MNEPRDCNGELICIGSRLKWPGTHVTYRVIWEDGTLIGLNENRQSAIHADKFRLCEKIHQQPRTKEQLFFNV